MKLFKMLAVAATAATALAGAFFMKRRADKKKADMEVRAAKTAERVAEIRKDEEATMAEAKRDLEGVIHVIKTQTSPKKRNKRIKAVTKEFEEQVAAIRERFAAKYAALGA